MTSVRSSINRHSDAAVEPFPVRRVASVKARPQDHRWLVEGLWLASGVGILGGAPKVGKTFLAAEIAIAVAAGDQVLGRPARISGPVLFYGAEDDLPDLRERFDGLTKLRGLEIARLAIDLLDIPCLRLERDQDLLRLRVTVERHQPRLLVLDPFIRLARIDENSAAGVSTILSSFRAIQRDYDVAVLLIHHTRKSPAANPNMALRGSSDFAAWSDSNLFLTRRRQLLTLSIEHRSAPAPDPISCRLVAEPAPHLHLDLDTQSPQPPLNQLEKNILSLLEAARQPITTTDLRAKLQRRKADVVETLEALRAQGKIQRKVLGWTLATRS
jgi:hypothetical protein